MPMFAVFVGTNLQKKILTTLYSQISQNELMILSLDDYYRFGLIFDRFHNVCILNDRNKKPWYDRNTIQKMFSLFPFLWQLFKISRSIKNFIFFVDTGVLERSAISFLNILGCKTIVLQDALKRIPKYASKRSLTWFGGGGASVYLLTGKRFVAMVRKGIIKVVGSPLYSNAVSEYPIGNKILLINQCFAHYGETSEREEYNFILDLLKDIKHHGEIELRLHPHNSYDLYKNLNSSNVIVTRNKPLKNSLMDAGIVIAINSTVIIEALCFGRPVLTLDWHPSPYYQPIKKGIIRCLSVQQLNYELTRWRQGQIKFKDFADDVWEEAAALIECSGNESIQRICKAINYLTFQ